MPAYKCSICSYRFDDGFIHTECPSCGQTECLMEISEQITTVAPVEEIEIAPIETIKDLWAQNEQEDEDGLAD
jgi:uncharacterized Zn finger protein (UPF0148 family)